MHLVNSLQCLIIIVQIHQRHRKPLIPVFLTQPIQICLVQEIDNIEITALTVPCFPGDQLRPVNQVIDHDSLHVSAKVHILIVDLHVLIPLRCRKRILLKLRKQGGDVLIVVLRFL